MGVLSVVEDFVGGLPLDPIHAVEFALQPEQSARRVSQFFKKRKRGGLLAEASTKKSKEGDMPYVAGKSKPKQYTPKRSGGVYKKQEIRKIARQVAIQNAETKHIARSLGSYTMYHNIPARVSTNLMYSLQGTADSITRIGDEIHAVGVKLYIQFEDKPDQPNVTYRIWVLKCRNGIAQATTPPLKAITNQLTMDPVDTEKVMQVKLNRSYRFSHKNTFIDVAGGNTYNKETTHHAVIWIPLNEKYKYEDASVDIGTVWNLPMWVGAYANSGELVTTNIANIRVASELFFKDP